MSLAVDAIESQIQKQIGEFLILKSKLVKMRASKSPAIKQRANELFAERVEIENNLKDSTKKIENIKSGAYTFSDIASLATLAQNLSSHIRDTKRFLSGKKVPMFGFVNKTATAALGALGLLWFVRR